MSSVEQLIEKARIAQQVYEKYDQGAVDEVVTAVAWALIEPGRNRELSQMAVETTGLGKIEDKILKNERKTLGLLRDLRGAKSVGVISEDEELGITEIARPVGVVAAVTPSTNPVATPTNNTLNALKGRNAIIIAPSPAGEKVCSRLLQYFHEELRRIGAPVDLIQQLPSPVDKIRTIELMKLADWLIVTGSQSNVRAAYSSGTPAIGVGAGNVTVIVDETADLHAAAFKIMKSKTFDHATSCSSENALVLVDEIYDTFLRKNITKAGHDKARTFGYSLANSVIDAAQRGTFTDSGNTLLTIRAREVELGITNFMLALGTLTGLVDSDPSLHLTPPFVRYRSEIAFIQLGNATITGIPGELYPEIAVGGIENPKGADYLLAPQEIPHLRSQLPGDVNLMVNLANDAIGYIIPKSEWDDEAPWIYGEEEETYGEIVSLGPDTAPAIHRAVTDIIKGDP